MIEIPESSSVVMVSDARKDFLARPAPLRFRDSVLLPRWEAELPRHLQQYIQCMYILSSPTTLHPRLRAQIIT